MNHLKPCLKTCTYEKRCRKTELSCTKRRNSPPPGRFSMAAVHRKKEQLTVVEASDDRPKETWNEMIDCGCKGIENMDVGHLEHKGGGDGKNSGDSKLQNESNVHPWDATLEDVRPSEGQQCSIEHLKFSIENTVPCLSLEEQESPLENSVSVRTGELCVDRKSEDAASSNSTKWETRANTDYFHSSAADPHDPSSPLDTPLPSMDGDQVLPATDSNFDTFLYWRLPVPTVNIDLDVINAVPDSIHTVEMVNEEQTSASSSADEFISSDEDNKESLSAHSSFLSITDLSNLSICPASAEETEEVIRNIGGFGMMNNSLENVGMDVEEDLEIVNKDVMDDSLGSMDMDLALPQRDNETILTQQQDIVPQSLLDNYLGMVEPSRAQTVDSEIAIHCAYNLPAVAYTLGRENWHCIKNLYETLARTSQCKVRQTLALSIHEMAVILGEEITP